MPYKGVHKTLKVGIEAKEQYKETCPTSWKKCKGMDSALKRKIFEKVRKGKSVPHNYGAGFVLVRYYYLNFKINLQNNEVIQISEVMNQQPFYPRKKNNPPLTYVGVNKMLRQKWSNILKTAKGIYSLLFEGYAANFDGSYRNGQLGIGFRITSSDGHITIFEHSEAIQCHSKFMDNSDAELIALIKLLEKIKDLKIRNIKINGDCQGFIDVINRNYSIKPRLKGYIDNIHLLVDSNGIKIGYVKRKFNHAHNLSRLSIVD